MMPWEDSGESAERWLRALERWRAAQRAARFRQDSARLQLDAAEGWVSTIEGWRGALRAAQRETADNAVDLDAANAELARTNASIAAVSAVIADHEQAREIATARVLAGPPSATPVVLLPLRVQTQWKGRTLAVRFYPDAIGIDSHDPRLAPEERSAGAAYWSMTGTGTAADARQAWENLVRRTSAPRAAWIVRATDPSIPRPAPAPAKASPWETAVAARLLPDRFAVIAYVAGEPVNVAAAAQPPRYVTWGRPLPAQLAIDGLHAPAAATWMTDLPAALNVGMAVQIEVPGSVTRIEQLLVIGLRSGARAPAGGLADLLDAHAFSDGLEVLPDGAPTNNSEQIRAAHSPLRDADVAWQLVDPARPAALPDASGGAQLAEILGVSRARLAAVGGATTDRRTAAQAGRLLVGIAARGPLGDLALSKAPAAWPLVAPAGPAPVLRAGRQPYGVLPASAPLRWRAAPGELSGPLAPLLKRWGAAGAAVVDRDPGDPPPAVPAARAISRNDDSALHALLLETASALHWSDGAAIVYSGLDGLVGATAGPQSPAAYLTALANATDAGLDAVAATLPPALLARVALGARRRVGAGDRAALVAGLRSLAARAASPGGRDELARVITQHLDALSHRSDVWLTAATTERLRAQRRATPPAALAVGAYGYVTDVEPRTQPRSHGHVHAPSLAHAATAAVLRAGYLGQRRAAWAEQVCAARDALGAAPLPGPEREAAQRALDNAEAGLAELRPLDADAESALALAVDISSRRVREARLVLSAVRTGQPLAAVLGYQFERDLADAGLQQYLAPCRKLTRFSTGTKLEALETARRTAQDLLAAALRRLAELNAVAAAAAPAVATATEAEQTAQRAQQRAAAAAGPFVAMEAELAQLDGPGGIRALEAALAQIDGRRPESVTTQRPIEVPDEEP